MSVIIQRSSSCGLLACDTYVTGGVELRPTNCYNRCCSGFGCGCCATSQTAVECRLATVVRHWSDDRSCPLRVIVSSFAEKRPFVARSVASCSASLVFVRTKTYRVSWSGLLIESTCTLLKLSCVFFNTFFTIVHSFYLSSSYDAI